MTLAPQASVVVGAVTVAEHIPVISDNVGRAGGLTGPERITFCVCDEVLLFTSVYVHVIV